MTMSERFYRDLDKMAKRSRNRGLAGTVEEVRSSFEDSMGSIPQGLVRAVYLHFLDRFNKSGKPEEDFVLAAYDLGAYIDLFWKEYADEQRRLEDEDWTFLRNAVSAAAGQMDMGILTYVMGQMVDRGKI